MIRRSYGVWIDRRATRPARHSASRGPSSYVGVSRVFACTALRVTGSCMSSWPQRADPVQQRYSAWIDERVCQRIACPCLHGPGCQGSRISKRAQRADLAWQRYSVWIDGRAVPSGRKGQCRPRHPICLTYRVPLFCISQRTGRTTPKRGQHAGLVQRRCTVWIDGRAVPATCKDSADRGPSRSTGMSRVLDCAASV